jgi:hypothetical protein
MVLVDLSAAETTRTVSQRLPDADTRQYLSVATPQHIRHDLAVWNLSPRV